MFEKEIYVVISFVKELIWSLPFIFKHLLALLIACALIFHFIYQIKDEIKGKKRKWKIAILVFLFTATTLITLINGFRPVFMKEEVIDTSNILNYNKGKTNIYFKTKLKIIEPIELKIKNTYNNLAYCIDYDCDGNFVFINYMFGDKQEYNDMVARRGLMFVYKAQTFFWNKDYRDYVKELIEFRKQRQKLLWPIDKSNGFITGIGSQRNMEMSETGIIMAIIGFVLGSIQYQLRIRLADVKNSMYRVIKFYCGKGEYLSIYKVKELMIERLKLNLDENEKSEYERCLQEWQHTYSSLHFWGVIFPLLFLGLYAIYKYVVFFKII